MFLVDLLFVLIDYLTRSNLREKGSQFEGCVPSWRGRNGGRQLEGVRSMKLLFMKCPQSGSKRIMTGNGTRL